MIEAHLRREKRKILSFSSRAVVRAITQTVRPFQSRPRQAMSYVTHGSCLPYARSCAMPTLQSLLMCEEPGTVMEYL